MSWTIVCGVDDSDTAELAARKAAKLALGLDAELHLVTAYGRLESEVVDLGSERYMVSNEAEADRTVRTVLGALRRDHPQLRAVPHTSDGRVSDALVKVADDVGADLIVVGNRRVQGITRILGSVARDVAARAACDVYIAHTTHRQ